MSDYHLMRVDYQTDATDDDPEYRGSLSTTIPERALRDFQIVTVDWSERGWVSVTYLVPGPGHTPEGRRGEGRAPGRRSRR